jgi:hypothetical protein
MENPRTGTEDYKPMGKSTRDPGKRILRHV